MVELSVRNLAIYSMHVLVVVSAATVGITLLRLALPRARLTFWRAVVLVCVLLPVLPARSVEVNVPVAVIVSGVTSQPADAVATVAPSLAPMLPRLVTSILIIGVLARSLWLSLGLVRLTRLRRQSHPISLGADIEALRLVLAPKAELRIHERLAQPVTFGLRRPVILLPPRLDNLSLDIPSAVVCHELIHVGRRDWLWVIVEEVVRTAFWFHPAMRWALAQ